MFVHTDSRSARPQGQLWLNIASSLFVLPGFINLDNHVFLNLSKWRLIGALLPRQRKLLDEYRRAHSTAQLIRHDCRKPVPFPSGSVDHILCSHFLEHVYPDEAEAILRDFHRALKPGGTVHIIVPDLAEWMAEYRRTGDADAFILDTMLSTKGRGSLRYRLLEALGGFGLQHRWMYDHASISRRIEQAGFRITDQDSPSSFFRAGDGSIHVTAVKI